MTQPEVCCWDVLKILGWLILNSVMVKSASKQISQVKLHMLIV